MMGSTDHYPRGLFRLAINRSRSSPCEEPQGWKRLHRPPAESYIKAETPTLSEPFAHQTKACFFTNEP